MTGVESWPPSSQNTAWMGVHLLKMHGYKKTPNN